MSDTNFVFEAKWCRKWIVLSVRLSDDRVIVARFRAEARDLSFLHSVLLPSLPPILSAAGALFFVGKGGRVMNLNAYHIWRHGMHRDKVTFIYRVCCNVLASNVLLVGAWVGVVVKALRHHSDEPEIDSRWCHWIFQWHIPSDRTMALGSTQPLVKISTRNISWG
jgi:hypothetical protein